MQLQAVFLYSDKDQRHELLLRPGSVNVILGENLTGKTALSSVVEYCLGSSESKIPRTKEFSAVAWVGIHFSHADHQCFIARRLPIDDERTNSDCYLEFGAQIVPPARIETKNNTNIQGVLKFLAELIGLDPYVSEPDPTQTRPPLEVTFKHAKMFCFQRQYEIANPYILFHGTEDPFVSMALKDMMPYFLGATTERRIEQREELRRIRTELRKADLDAQRESDTEERLLSRANRLYMEAVNRQLASRKQPFDKLAEVVEALREIKIEPYESETTSSPGMMLHKIEEEIDTISTLVAEQLRKYNALRVLEQNAMEAGLEVREQSSRLAIMDFFGGQQPGAISCPVCGQVADETLPNYEELHRARQLLETRVAGIESTTEEISREKSKLMIDVQEKQGRLADLDKTRRAMLQQEQELAEKSSWLSLQQRTVGRISYFLDELSDSGLDASARQRLYHLQRTKKAISEALSKDRIVEVTDRLTDQISSDLNRLCRLLDDRYQEYKFRFDPYRLNVYLDEEKPVTLLELGGGQNWMIAHVICHLALHRFFVLHKRPVPNFLFLDQPSQVFFSNTSVSDNAMDRDREMLDRLYDVIHLVVNELAPDFQVIITEHGESASDWFQHAIRDEWRHGKGFVPASWF